MQLPCVGISVHRLAGSSVHRERGELTSAAPVGVAAKDWFCRHVSFGSKIRGFDSRFLSSSCPSLFNPSYPQQVGVT